MNKKIITVVLIFIIIITVYYTYSKLVQQFSPVVSNVITSDNSSESIKKYPFDFQDFFKGENKNTLSSVKTSYGELSFELLTDKEHSGTLSRSYGVMLNIQKIGEVGGEGFGMNTFSPNNRYYSLEVEELLVV
jgi:predicted PurR-regulated permease PerM